MPSTSATKRLQAFRTMEHRAVKAEQAAKSLRAELAALRSSSERQITNLRAEVDRQRTAPGTVDLSEWAADLAADSLEPGGDAITVDGDGKPIVRILLAFSPTMSQRAREGFVLGLGQALANGF